MSIVFRNSRLRIEQLRRLASRPSNSRILAASFSTFPSKKPSLFPPNPEATGGTGNRHRSNAEEVVAKTPVIEVDGPVALCTGGGGTLGHPVQYIQLITVDGDPQPCLYCGLRYIRKPKAH